MPQSLATLLKNGSTTTEESKMKYYIAPHKTFGGVQVWRVVKRLRDFKPEEGQEYIVKTNKRQLEMGDSLPIYIGLNGKLQKCSSFALFLF